MGLSGIISDSVIMVFVLTSLTVLIITFFTELKLKKNILTGLSCSRRQAAVLKKFPVNIWKRAVVLGIVYAAVLVPLLTLALTLLNINSMTFWEFVLFKASFAGFNAALIGPLTAFYALCCFSFSER